MDQSLRQQVAALSRLTVKQLQQRFHDEFGETTKAHNKTWLIKRIAWRLQARLEGGLSERAIQRAAELVDDADLRILPPRVNPMQSPVLSSEPGRMTDRRLPPPGTVLTRTYKGGRIQVQIHREGFEYEGERFPSLSAVAKRITGTHINGYRFFQLDAGGAA